MTEVSFQVVRQSLGDSGAAALRAATAAFVALVPESGEFPAGAQERILEVLAEHPDVDLLYTDELIGGGNVAIKPDFSPERLRNQFYLGELVVYRRSFLESLGGISESHEGAESYELALRASRAAPVVLHVREVLYQRSTAFGAPLSAMAAESTRRALEEHLAATGGGEVRSIGADGVHDTRRMPVGEPLVSIIIPTQGLRITTDEIPHSYLLDAVRSILDLSTYTNLEFVVVIDEVADATVVRELRELTGDRLTLVPFALPFNFSEKINHGAVAASGEYFLILNDDVKVLTPDWIESLLGLAQLPRAGMSGAMLYYADETIQHAGHHYYEQDASHIGLDIPRGDAGPLQGYRVEREVSGVTAACAMMPGAVFREVGGLSSLLPGNFNDVDLCMKVTWAGYDIYWTPHAELYHFESKTRDASVHPFEIDVAWGRWGFRMHDLRYWPYPHTRTPAKR